MSNELTPRTSKHASRGRMTAIALMLLCGWMAVSQRASHPQRSQLVLETRSKSPGTQSSMVLITGPKGVGQRSTFDDAIPNELVNKGGSVEKRQLPVDPSIHLADGSEIAFVLSDIADSARARFRYRMDGRDQSWQAPMPGQTDIDYSNLSPGNYRFHLQYAGTTGQWNDEERDVTVYVEPSWWQSPWARSAEVALGFITVWFLYRLNKHRQSIVLRARLSERVKERTRLAREVQDTILQGAQGLILIIESISMKLDESDPHRRELDAALTGAQRSLGEVRDVVEELQASPVPVERIEEVLRDVWRRSCATSRARFSIKCHGRPRRRSDFDTSEAIFVATRAIQRACATPKTRNIEVRISFARTEMKLDIWNDNFGEHDFEPVEYDWGLSAMRRRAALGDGTLTFEKTRPNGTRLTLTLTDRSAVAAPVLSLAGIKAVFRD